MKRQKRVALSLLLVGIIVVAGWSILTRNRADHRPPMPPVADSSPLMPETLNVSVPVQETPAPETAVSEVALSNPVAVVEAPVLAVAIAEVAAESAEPTTLAPSAAKARSLIADGKQYEARALLTKLILAAQDGQERDELRALLDALNQQIFFSRAPSPDSEFYTVQRGDAVTNIAKKYGKDIYFADLILKINGMKDPRRIQPGQKLKIPIGTFSGLVQKKPHRLIILFNGAYIKEYPVALGTPASPTPAVTFKVANNKTVNPDWKGIKFGDPENVLGTRWIGFEDTQDYFGYGIHGTSLPDTVGKDASDGCIRLLNSDVEEVFTMLMHGNTVEVAP
jgi:lipoprotein-anchoring transpeptidase ErfK/SrfK